jgi:type I restriction enzyme S subunit
MRYPAYPEYKESGVQWLGRVPEHWEVKSLRYVSRFAYGDSLSAETREEGDIPVYGSNGQVGTHSSSNTNAPVIIVGRKGSFGKINYSNVPVFAIDTTYFIDSRYSLNDISWLKYSLTSIGLDQVSKDSAVPGLAREDAYEKILPVPPLFEQSAIADFLDRETGRIDTLMAKKRRLIELLREKRSALISRTVTRGLPDEAAREFGLEPHTRFKDSGIAWLGEVPEGWEVRPIKSIVNIPITDGPHETPEILNDGVPFVSAEAISGGKINFDRIRGYISKEDHLRFSKKYKPQYGDVYMVKSGATTGRIAMVETDEEFNIWSPLAAIRSNPAITDRLYLYFYLHSKEFQTAVTLSWSFGTQQNIGMGVIQNLFIPVSSISEQSAIASYLDRETAKIDRLVEKVEEALERLQEYRTALITAAVTGKIDVRGALRSAVQGELLREPEAAHG